MAYNHFKAMEENQQKYPVNINGQLIELSEGKIGELIKEKLKNSRSMQRIFEQFEVSPGRLDNLTITIEPLEGRYAETDLETMKLNPTLFEGGRFFEEQFFVICHELIHFLSRCKESDATYNDPEETLGMVSSIAYELEQDTPMDEIWNKLWSKISWHFNDERDAREFMKRLFEKAMKMVN